MVGAGGTLCAVCLWPPQAAASNASAKMLRYADAQSARGRLRGALIEEGMRLVFTGTGQNPKHFDSAASSADGQYSGTPMVTGEVKFQDAPYAGSIGLFGSSGITIHNTT